MAIYKLTTEEINAAKVEGKSSFLNNGVAANQRIFDALPLKVNEKLNAVIDEVNETDKAFSEHTANANNPHNVTKAQLGLGNVDNTADADKPVSKLVQAELDKKADAADVNSAVSGLQAGLGTKADKSEVDVLSEIVTGLGDVTEILIGLGGKANKATTLSGYGITDAYTKAQTDSKLSDKADVTGVYTKTEVDNKLTSKANAADVNSAVSGLQAGLGGKADKATTLSGYGITDAYTKAQTDAKLSGKADATGVYTKTEVDNKLTSKANVADVNSAVSGLQTGLGTKADKAELGDVATEDIVPIEKGGTGARDAASALAALGGVRISTKQTYSGGGFCDNYLHLEFEFSPKLMFICGGGCSAVFARDTDKAPVCGPTSNSDGSAHYCELVWGGDNSVWWKSDTVMSQLNLSGEIYTAYAIG